MKELVTILLPVYNGELYIEQMLNSVFSQDYRPIEVIITDDASRDNTVFIIERWLKGGIFENISFQFITNAKNRGLSENISRAARYVHGKYLFLADQDDIWKANKVSAQVEYLKQNDDCIICICDRSIIDSDNKVLCSSLFRYKNVDISKRDYKKILRCPPLYAANCMCLKTEHLDVIFPIPKSVCSHDMFITIMAAHYGKVAYLNKALTLYRIHDNNLSGQYALETNKNLLKAAYIILKKRKRTYGKKCIDLQIIEKELKKRFHEDISKQCKNISMIEESNPYWGTIQYIFCNLDKWKKWI